MIFVTSCGIYLIAVSALFWGIFGHPEAYPFAPVAYAVSLMLLVFDGRDLRGQRRGGYVAMIVTAHWVSLAIVLWFWSVIDPASQAGLFVIPAGGVAVVAGIYAAWVSFKILAGWI